MILSLYFVANSFNVSYLELLRPKHWVKNLFLFIPLFFAGEFLNVEKAFNIFLGFIAFSAIASSIYIINDYFDIEDDRKHPKKRYRPLASGAVSKPAALGLFSALVVSGFVLSWFIRDKFTFVLAIYFLVNMGYSFGLKNIPILDIILLASGFVLRVKAGSVIGYIPLSEWIVIMIFLLALFMAIGKRRDDVLLKISSGLDMRKSIHGYNLELLNVLLALICAVLIVAYFMYSMSRETNLKFGTHRLYYTCLFVMAGVMRYLQIIFVQVDSGSPTKILYKDRFIQVVLFLWVASFIMIIYLKDVTIFK